MLKRLFFLFFVFLITKSQAQNRFARADTVTIACNDTVETINVLLNDSLIPIHLPALVVGSELNLPGGSYYCDTCDSKEGGSYTLIGDTFIQYRTPTSFHGWDEIIYLLSDTTIGRRNHYDSARVAIFIDTCITPGIREYQNTNSIDLFPNPAWNSTTVVFGNTVQDTRLRIFDLSGALVHEENLSSVKEVQLDLSNFSSGIYFIELKLKGGFLGKKLIKY